MKIVPIQEVYARKLERQGAIPGLELHAGGHCAHVGQLSPGCQGCFVPTAFSYNIRIGPDCNLDCVYCHGTGMNRKSEELPGLLVEMCGKALTRDLRPSIPRLSFSGGGDPLLYLDDIEPFMREFQGVVARDMNRKPWVYLYTNGLLADLDTLLLLKDLGFYELRFHLGASNFSRAVYANMERAAAHIPVISVETPAWPPHRAKLFEMLPRLEDLGVQHLNLGEVMLTAQSLERVGRALPEAEIYQTHEIHLYDGGLVYDLIEEVLARGYAYSILDCNSFVKSMQRSPGKWVAHEPVDGLCAEYDLPPFA